MSRFMKVMGLCLVAAFVMSAMAAGTASAAKPEFLFQGSKPDFSSKSGAGKLETSSGETVSCTADTDRGEVEGASGSKKVTDVLISFTGCTSKILTITYKCQTAGANPEEIKTTDLEGELGYIKKAAPVEVGLLLKPKGTNLFAEFECVHNTEKIIIKVKGSIIGKITPINKLVDPGEHATLTYEKGAKTGEPEITKFEGGAKDELLTETTISKKFLESSIAGSKDEIFFLESIEICA
jgi:hypothetical protein